MLLLYITEYWILILILDTRSPFVNHLSFDDFAACAISHWRWGGIQPVWMWRFRCYVNKLNFSFLFQFHHLMHEALKLVRNRTHVGKAYSSPNSKPERTHLLRWPHTACSHAHAHRGFESCDPYGTRWPQSRCLTDTLSLELSWADGSNCALWSMYLIINLYTIGRYPLTWDFTSMTFKLLVDLDRKFLGSNTIWFIFGGLDSISAPYCDAQIRRIISVINYTDRNLLGMCEFEPT